MANELKNISKIGNEYTFLFDNNITLNKVLEIITDYEQVNAEILRVIIDNKYIQIKVRQHQKKYNPYLTY